MARLLAWLPSALVLGELSIFYSLVVRMRLVTGRWPVVYGTDASEAGVVLHVNLALFGLLVAMTSPGLGVVTMVAASKLGLPRKQLLIALAVFVSLYGSAVLLFWSDPGRFWDWFLD